MSISRFVQVNTYYTRSINIERDASTESIVKAYIPTSRAMRTFETMANAFVAKESPKAWSLTGPYGSGKSSYAIFLTHLLGNSNAPATKIAHVILKNNNAKLQKKYQTLLKGNNGFCHILITGSTESLRSRFIKALADKAAELLGNSEPQLISKLLNLSAEQTIHSTTVILSCIDELQQALQKAQYSGLLIMVDELGKFLEFEARHNSSDDIFLLQSIAEKAQGLHPVKLALVVMMHQSFDQYAKGLGETLKNEWSKVQGRFENIPFIESAEQVLRVVSTAITHSFTKEDTHTIKEEAQRITKVLVKAKALLGTMDEYTATELFTKCYPLHPVSALLLPLLCQKVAQNERTLFSYLGSQELHGFRHSITHCQKAGDWIYPWEIYEYFILNQSTSLFDHHTHRRWAEVVTAIERIGDATENEIRILKTIGLLNIVGAQGNFKASKDLIKLCLPKQSMVKRAIKALDDKSVIQFRKFSSEYRVWQGSDFDLDSKIQIERARSRITSLANSLNARHSLVPVVARKYTIQNGTLRYFYSEFADKQTRNTFDINNLNARIIFYLASDSDDIQWFKQKVSSVTNQLDIYVLCTDNDQLRESTEETLTLEAIQHTAQELHTDPIAQREFKDRYNAITSREHYLLEQFIANPEINDWYWNQNELSIPNKRSLQDTLSSVLKHIYSKAPIFNNELINREKPSAQANAAKRKLALAMLNCHDKNELGIEKFPPEKSIYQSCLHATKLHTQNDDGTWSFHGPKSTSKVDDPYNISPVWHRIELFLERTIQEPQSFADLNRELIAPPYGVKAGMLPLLYMTVLMANKKELAIYFNNVFTPYFTDELLDHFLKRPDQFKVQRFLISGLNQTIHDVYSNVLYKDGKQRSLLDLIKPIASLILNLPQYTQTTKLGLSQKAQDVRNLFKLSKSPIKLMLEELPTALGVNIQTTEKHKNILEALPNQLMVTLKELKDCLPTLKSEFKETLAKNFKQNTDISLQDLRNTMSGRCRGLEEYTIDRDGLKAFIHRIHKDTASVDEWFDDLLGFLGQQPIDKWGDTEQVTAKRRLNELTQKLSELERLRIYSHQDSSARSSNFDVYLLRSIKKGGEEFDEVAVIDGNKIESIQHIKAALDEVFKDYDRDLQVAALAAYTNEELINKKITDATKTSSNTIKRVK